MEKSREDLASRVIDDGNELVSLMGERPAIVWRDKFFFLPEGWKGSLIFDWDMGILRDPEPPEGRDDGFQGLDYCVLGENLVEEFEMEDKPGVIHLSRRFKHELQGPVRVYLNDEGEVVIEDYQHYQPEPEEVPPLAEDPHIAYTFVNSKVATRLAVLAVVLAAIGYVGHAIDQRYSDREEQVSDSQRAGEFVGKMSPKLLEWTKAFRNVKLPFSDQMIERLGDKILPIKDEAFVAALREVGAVPTMSGVGRGGFVSKVERGFVLGDDGEILFAERYAAGRAGKKIGFGGRTAFPASLKRESDGSYVLTVFVSKFGKGYYMGNLVDLIKSGESALGGGAFFVRFDREGKFLSLESDSGFEGYAQCKVVIDDTRTEVACAGLWEECEDTMGNCKEVDEWNFEAAEECFAFVDGEDRLEVDLERWGGEAVGRTHKVIYQSERRDRVNICLE